jgi:hypothetical protein
MLVVPASAHAELESKELDHEDGHYSLRYLIGDRVDDGSPQAILADFRPEPGGSIHPHFHEVRQFQVFVDGDAALGKKPMPAVSFHYDDPYKPYGPIITDGLRYLVLRADSDVGSFPMPGSREKLRRQDGRAIAVNVPQAEDGSGVDTLLEPHADGLAAFRLRLAEGEERTGPTPAGSGGQYYIVLGGSVELDGQLLDRLSLIFVGPDDEAPSLCARAADAEVLVLQFPIEEGPARGKRRQ